LHSSFFISCKQSISEDEWYDNEYYKDSKTNEQPNISGDKHHGCFANTNSCYNYNNYYEMIFSCKGDFFASTKDDAGKNSSNKASNVPKAA